MLSTSNRRLARRFNLQIPLLFCPADTTFERGFAVKSINISSGGVYFKTEERVAVGLPVRVLLQMPSKCGGTRLERVIFTGRVSHVAKKRRACSGVGVEFFYSEPEIA